MNANVNLGWVLPGILLFSVLSAAQETAPPPQQPTLSEEQAAGYAMGVQFGKNLENLGVPIDREMVFQGMKDVLDKKPLQMTQEDIKAKTRDLFQQAQKRQVEEHQRLMLDNMAQQKAFLEENKTKEGITTLENGLQYKVLKAGKGKTPTMTDRVKLKYSGRLLDGSEFDNTEKRGGALDSQVNKLLIPGLRQAVQLMKEGDRWELYVPSNLGYGMQPVPKVGPNQLLILDVELLEVLPPAAEPTPDAQTAQPPAAPPQAPAK